MPAPPANAALLPSLVVVVCGALWGLFWIPARWFAAHGLDGIWLAILLFAFSGLAMIVPAFVCRRDIAAASPDVFITGLLTGAGFAFYTVSLTLTDVLHALLLFYLTPVWSTLLARVLLGTPITLTRIAAVGLGFAGLMTVLDASSGLPLPRNAGDALALASGVCWAYGSLRNYSATAKGVVPTVTGFTVGGAAAALAFLAVPGVASVPAPETWPVTLPGLAFLALVLFVPTNFLLMWGTHHVDPGRVGILLMSELVVGAASAALWSGEAYGGREIAGALLIITAGLVDTWGSTGVRKEWQRKRVSD